MYIYYRTVHNMDTQGKRLLTTKIIINSMYIL